MSGHTLRAIPQSLRSLLTARVNYHHAPDAESTELHAFSAHNDDETYIAKPDTASGSNFKEEESIQDSRSATIRRYKHRFSGWRFGILNFAAWASVVFIINLAVTIWGSVTHEENKGVMSQGDCGRIKTFNSGLHILINILSTILLSGSNYCMQCMSAPSREEIDKAHSTRGWLDVGIPSFRNLRHIQRGRLVLWLLLGVSSVPLHLLYNSAVYAAISINSYDIFVVSQAFVDDPECRNCTGSLSNNTAVLEDAQMLQNFWAMSRNETLEKLSPLDCLNAYGTQVQSTRRNLLVVTANENVIPGPPNHSAPRTSDLNNTNVYSHMREYATEALRHYKQHSDSLKWICTGLASEGLCINKIEEIRNSPQPWTLSSGCYSPIPGWCDGTRWPVEYCLSEPAKQQCSLNFSPTIAIIVTILNFFKAILMFYIVYATKRNPIITMGDAVASFLDDKDATTMHMGPISVIDCRKKYSTGAITWPDPRWRWKDATSRQRRMVTLVLFASALALVVGLMIWAVRETNYVTQTSTSDVFRFGFGAVDSRAMISSDYMPADIVGLALVANLPQVLLSFLYFAYNGLFTAMLMGYEWMSYAYKRKGLRTSRKPFGAQRSTYFLQLPYRFGVPLVILSGTLHWLVSQSIFVVAFDVYDQHGEQIESGLGIDWDAQTKSCGYSPIAMLAVVILGFCMVAAVIAFGYMPYKRGMPLAGSCSLAISAACHPEQHSEAGNASLSEQKLQWGVVSTSVDGVGHCAFSSKDVGPVVKGRTYA